MVFDGKALEQIYAKVKKIASAWTVKRVLDGQLNIVKILLKKLTKTRLKCFQKTIALNIYVPDK